MNAVKLENMKYMGFVTLVALLGCSGEDRAPAPPAAPPERIEADGTTWTRQDGLSANDTRVLHRLFQSNRTVSDNPDFRGKPSVFHCENGARRYYWSRASGSDRRAAYVQVDANGAYQKIGETDFSAM